MVKQNPNLAQAKKPRQRAQRRAPAQPRLAVETTPTRYHSISGELTTAANAARVHSLCGLIDPFCSHAIGAKYPDLSSNKSLPFTYKTLDTVTTNAGGDVSFIVLPVVTADPLLFGTNTGSLFGPGTFSAPRDRKSVV